MAEFKGTKGKWQSYTPDHIGCTNVKFGKEEWDGFIEVWHHHNGSVQAKSNALLISKAPEMLEMLKYFTAFPDEDFEEDMDKHISFPMTVDARKIKEAKQLIKEATEL